MCQCCWLQSMQGIIAKNFTEAGSQTVISEKVFTNFEIDFYWIDSNRSNCSKLQREIGQMRVGFENLFFGRFFCRSGRKRARSAFWRLGRVAAMGHSSRVYSYCVTYLWTLFYIVLRALTNNELQDILIALQCMKYLILQGSRRSKKFQLETIVDAQSCVCAIVCNLRVFAAI